MADKAGTQKGKKRDPDPTGAPDDQIVLQPVPPGPQAATGPQEPLFEKFMKMFVDRAKADYSGSSQGW